MKILRAVIFYLCFILFAGFFQVVSAATITPVSGTTTNNIADGAIANVIDGSMDVDVNLALGTATVGGPFGGPYTVSFDLGNSYDLTGFSLWNNGGEIANDGEGVNSFTLNFFDSSMGSVGTFSNTAQDILTEQSFTFPAAASNVQTVDFVINSNHAVSPERVYVYFHEINFEGTAVPIPSAIWLLGSGLFGLVGIKRKFKKA